MFEWLINRRTCLTDFMRHLLYKKSIYLQDLLRFFWNWNPRLSIFISSFSFLYFIFNFLRCRSIILWIPTVPSCLTSYCLSNTLVYSRRLKLKKLLSICSKPCLSLYFSVLYFFFRSLYRTNQIHGGEILIWLFIVKKNNSFAYTQRRFILQGLSYSYKTIQTQGKG